MKTPAALLALFTLACCPLTLSAQVSPPGATPAKKAVFSSSDKLLVKNMVEAYLPITHLAEMLRQPTAPGGPAVKTLATSANKLTEAWGDIVGVAVKNGVENPKTDQTAMEKKELAEIKKAPGDKFDKAWLKAMARETKKANSAFTNGEKYAVDPDLKAAFAKWLPVITKLDADTIAAAAPAPAKK